MRKNPLIILCFFGLIFFDSGCRIQKGLTSADNRNLVSADELIDLVVENNITDKSFNLPKAVVQYSDEVNSLSFLLSLKHDSTDSYLAVIRAAAGIELYRLYFNRDTFLINDRLKRELIKGGTDILLGKYGLSFDMLGILFGDSPLNVQLNENVEECINNSKSFAFKSANVIGDLDVNCGLGKIQNVRFKSDVSGVMNIRFTKFDKKDNLIYPRLIEVVRGESMFKMSMIIENIEMPLDEPIEFVPGRNYEIRILN